MIQKIKSRKTQGNITEIIGVARSVILRLYHRFQEAGMLVIDQVKIFTFYHANDDRYTLLITRRTEQQLSSKDS